MRAVGAGSDTVDRKGLHAAPRPKNIEPAQAAAIAVRTRAGMDLEPVFFMIAAR